MVYLITSSEFGGAQKYVFDLATNLNPQENKIVVAVGSHGDGEFLKKLAAFPYIKTVQLKNLKRLPNPLTAKKCLKEITTLLRQEKPDVLHLNSTTAGCLGSLAAKIYKKKTGARLRVIYTVHGWAFLEPGFIKSKIYLLAEKLTAPYKDLFIVLSETDRQVALKKYLVPAEKIKKIYNGLNPNSLQFLPVEQAKKILPSGWQKNNKPVIATIANFYKTKGLKFLIKAIALIKNNSQPQQLDDNPLSFIPPFFPQSGKGGQIGDCQLLIIGDGPERKKLERLIANLNLKEQVFLAGRIPQASQYLKAFNIFVLPSVKEGMPFAILEAMAADLPIIATRVGGLPEIIENNVSGILVEPKNPLALAKAIKDLLNDPAKQKNLAIQAKQQVLKFSLSQMLKQTFALY